MAGINKMQITGWTKVPSKKNSMGYNSKSKRVYKSADVKAFEDNLMQIAGEEKEHWQKSFGTWPMDTRYRMTVSVVYGDRRRRDVQNVFASVCDALQGIVYEDDAQIYEIVGKKQYEKAVWKYTITLEIL